MILETRKQPHEENTQDIYIQPKMNEELRGKSDRAFSFDEIKAKTTPLHINKLMPLHNVMKHIKTYYIMQVSMYP